MPKAESPRRAKTSHRSLHQKYKDYDTMTHSTWAAPSPQRATVSVPGKGRGFASKIFGAARNAGATALKGTAKGVRGLLTENISQRVNDPHAGQKREADRKQREFVGLRDLITGVQRANLIAGIAKSIAKK